MMTLSVAEARATFSRIVDVASSTHERYEVTRNGSRVAVLLGADDFDSLMETVAILSDPDLMAQIRVGLSEDATFSSDDVLDAMRKSGRLPQ